MQIRLVFALLALPLATPALATHEDDRVHEVFVPNIFYDRLFYLEERHSPDAWNGPEVVFDSSLWLYEEGNGMEGLQRGGIGLMGDWFPPGCDQTWTIDDLIAYLELPDSAPCLLIGEDPWNDETYGNGPDLLILSVPWVYTEEDYIETVRNTVQNTLGGDLDPFSPSNDYFAAATVEPEPYFYTTQSTRGASIEPGEPLCPNQTATVWFQFTPQFTEVYTIATLANFRASLGVFSGGPAVQTLTPIVCSDSWWSYEWYSWRSQVDVTLTAGVMYYIQAGGYGGSGEGGGSGYDYDSGDLTLSANTYSPWSP